MIERSFVMLKPDAVRRGLAGEIIRRFERASLKLKAIRLWSPPPMEIVGKHYPDTPEVLTRLGNISIRNFNEQGLDIKAKFGTDDPARVGTQIRKWLCEFLTKGEVLAMVWEGNDAVKNIRKLVGVTVPSEAAPGTIRGDFSVDSAALSNTEGRVLFNLIHASGNIEEAAQEVALWFPEMK